MSLGDNRGVRCLLAINRGTKTYPLKQEGTEACPGGKKQCGRLTSRSKDGPDVCRKSKESQDLNRGRFNGACPTPQRDDRRWWGDQETQRSLRNDQRRWRVSGLSSRLKRFKRLQEMIRDSRALGLSSRLKRLKHLQEMIRRGGESKSCPVG